MYQPPIKVRKQDVAPLVKATFPDYKGRTFKVRAAETVRLDDINWGGGSCSQYRACSLSGERLGGTDKYAAMAPWAHQVEGATLPIAPGAVVVEHSIFCGSDCGLTIHIHPADMPKFLPTN